ncbi:hypothetical protein GUJ93_ZPchr0010g9545 [Zizania palustris]|uniref:Uncharacterized protein n=1 Tax=Zizania palustris TaxID=103762 RepID=A0A8J5WAJ0_ZIZPA|nr:hypothetical protein GUJ93_ZPchr0010g9545 [Zizania palustris]
MHAAAYSFTHSYTLPACICRPAITLSLVILFIIFITAHMHACKYYIHQSDLHLSCTHRDVCTCTHTHTAHTHNL